MLGKFTSVALVALVSHVQSLKGITDSEQNRHQALLRGVDSVYGHRQLFINTAHMGGPLNARSNDLYSSIPYGEDLKTVGGKFTISHRDKFDNPPPAGSGSATLLSKRLKMESMNNAEATTWAEKHLGSNLVQSLVVPAPKHSIVDKELTVIATESIIAPSHPVFCHQSEVDKWFCHESHDTTDVTKVTVTTDDSNEPSVVWTACHDEEQYWCHIINVGDIIFAPKEKDDQMNLAPLDAASVCDGFALKMTTEIKKALEDEDKLKSLCATIDTSVIESTLVEVLTNHDNMCFNQVKLILLESLHSKIMPEYSDLQACVPELTKEKMMIDPYLAATVCGKECIDSAPALIAGMIVQNDIVLGSAYLDLFEE